MMVSKKDPDSFSNRLNVCYSLECGLHLSQRREPLWEERKLLSQQQLEKLLEYFHELIE